MAEPQKTLANGRKLPDISKIDVQVVRHGEQVVVPKGMTLPTAIAVLVRQMESEETFTDTTTAIDSYPLDLAYALTRAVEKRYNFVANKMTRIDTPFGPFEIPPAQVGLEIDVNKTAQVYWGQIPLPGFDKEEFVKGTVAIKNGIWVGAIEAHVKGKNKPAVDELIELVRYELANHSVYKGRAVKVDFQPANPRIGFNPDEQPRFMDLADVNPDDLIFGEKVMQQVQFNVFNLVEKTALCAKYGLPRKRGVLLEGPYGTGKTLTARVLAQKCEEHGWTFLYLKTVQMLPQAIQFARIFGRTVIFAEDVDQVFKGDSRDEDVNAVLNTIDGVDTKNSEVMVVLTTNNVRDIHKAMLRPGRLDAVINIAAPDAEATERLIRKYSRGLIAESVDLTQPAQLLSGKNAAAVREAVERAKSAALTHLNDGDELHLTGEDIQIAAEGMLYHLELLREDPEDKRSPMQILGDSISEGLSNIISESQGEVTTAENLKSFVETTIKTEMALMAKNGRKRQDAVVGEQA